MSGCRAIIVPLLGLAGAACGVDTTLKHRCARDSDCAPGRVCAEGICAARPADAGAPDRTSDATSEGIDEPRDTTMPNYVFVTSQKFRPFWPSIGIPDFECNQAAAEAGLSGTYRAWLSTSAVDAVDRLRGARGWIRPDGAPFADTVDDIVKGRIFNPPSVDEHQQRIFGSIDDPVTTGTTEDGVLMTDGNCHDWNDPIAGRNAIGGMPDATERNWTNAMAVAWCDSPARLYCFGVDRAAPVAPIPAEGKLVFVSSASFASGGGIARADELCNSEAAEAGFSGTFRALLAQTGAPASARIPSDQVWIRPDGVVLNQPGTNTLGPGPGAPPNVTARGTYDHRAVFTGATDWNQVAEATGNCDDWRDTDPTHWAIMGISNSVSSWFNAGGFGRCGYAGSIYCFQQ